MKNGNKIVLLLLLILSFTILSNNVLAQNIAGKIPITTSSNTALENYLMGRDLNEKLRFQDSREFFVRAVAEDPEFALGHLILASVQPTTAAFFDSFNKAKSLIDKVSDGEKLMILGVEAGGVEADPIKQQGIYKELVKAYPKDERAHNLMAQSYFSQHDYENAIAEYEMVIKINPDFNQAYNQLGYAYRFLENYSAAEKSFKIYISLLPYDPNPYDSYAELLMKMGKFDKSIANYQKALDINPSFTASYLGIASNFVLKGEHEPARANLHEFYTLSFDDNQRRDALFATALTYIDERNFDKALETLDKRMDYSEAINDTAAIATDLNIIGNVLLEKGKVGEALNHFEKSLKLVNGSSLAQSIKDLNEVIFYFNASRLYAVIGDYDKAKSFADKYNQNANNTQSPTQIRYTHELYGIIALNKNDFSTALTEFNQANLQNPYNLYRLGLAYEGLGNIEQAKQYYDQAANFNISNSMAYAFIRNKALQKASVL